MQNYKDFISEILIDEKTLQKRVKELGDQISHDYAGQDLLLACVLRGGIVFMVDLMRHITVPHALDCMALTSYGVGARASTGNIRMSLDLQTNIENKMSCWWKTSWIAGTPSSMCSKCSRHAAPKA